jgi:hypothetical protein
MQTEINESVHKTQENGAVMALSVLVLVFDKKCPFQQSMPLT